MYKKRLLSYTATAVILLFNIQFNAYAETLEVPEGKQPDVSEKTYETIQSQTGGQIIGKHLSVVGNKTTNTSKNTTVYVVTAEGANSAITLQDGTTIKGTDSVISLGVKAKDGATFQMTGGTITVSNTGALFWNNNKESKLKDVAISSGNDKAPLNFGVKADKNGTVTLENVKVTQAHNAIATDDHSTITVSGGSFDTKETTISALNGSTITLTDNAQITSSDDGGLGATTQSTITMTGGTVFGGKAALGAATGGHIKVTDVALKTKESGFGALSQNSNSMIELKNTTISDATIGLHAIDGGVISMTGGTITASRAAAYFRNSKSKENKLENVTISSGKNEAPLINGIKADKNSTVALKDVTVTQAQNAVVANNHSTITVSGGSFETTEIAVGAQNGSSIILTDNAQIKSSNDAGIQADGLNSTITMTKGTVTGKNVALTTTQGGHIKATDGTLKTNGDGFGVDAYNLGSMIELLGNTTISDSKIGLHAIDRGAISMTGGRIKTSKVGAFFENSKCKENKLENVTISSGKNEAPLFFGVKADGSTVTLKDITVTQAQNAINADDHSTITVSGGSFETKEATIFAQNGSTINLTENAQIISSKNTGLYSKDSGTTITMEKGNVTGKTSALMADNGGHIKVTDVTLKTTSDDISSSVNSIGKNSLIELHGNNTTMSDAQVGLIASDGGAISMTGGRIKASKVGAGFLNSNSNKNHLEKVTISSGQDDALLNFGVKADKNSTVALKDVTVTQAQNAINADDHSTISVSGGSFNAKEIAVGAQNGSTITLKDNVTVTSSEDLGLHAEGSKTKITMEKGSVTGKSAALAAEKGGQIDATNVSLTTEGKGTGVHALGTNSTIELHGDTTINNTLSGLGAVVGGKITSENLTIVGGKAIDENRSTGIWTTDSGSEIQLTGKTIIQNVDEGLYADGGSKITSGDLTITGGENNKEMTVGINIWDLDSVIEVNGKTTIQNVDFGLTAIDDGTIKISNNTIDPNSESPDTKSNTHQNVKKNKIEAKRAALYVINGGHIDLTDVSATAGISGLQFLALSNIDPNELADPLKHQNNEINLTNTNLSVENGTGIFIGAFTNDNIEDILGLSIGTVNLKNSQIHDDVLLGNGIFENPKSWGADNYWDAKNVKAITNGTFKLNANHSTLEGRTNIAKDRNVHFDLKNNTIWTLKNSAKEKDDDGNLLDIAQRSRSDISTLNLDNSSIVFNGPTEDHYHTLHIGSGKPDTQAVYNATGNAQIHFNVAWSDGVASADQKTDRLLIHGDVSGKTKVYIESDLGDKNSVINASDPSNIGGLSLIQVSGKAQEDSFKLANGYTTLKGEPYKYTLTAYGPDSSQGKADVAQNLFDEKNEDFWDFRLHKEILKTGHGSTPSVNALVPQTAGYIVMPNALFYSGLTDMAKQNALLANMRTSVLGKEEEKNTGFFLYTYGSTGTLSSERGPLKYGYGADLRYAALQAGVTLAAIEGQNSTTHFGLVATYGQLSFTPKDMQDAGKNTLDKWSLTAYGSSQYDNGFYVDTLLSYGILKGDITNAIIGKTAKLKNAKMLSISTTVGKQFATGTEGLTFEPQAQLAYQHLMFDTITDVNNFTVDMNNPHQWMIRVGGRLTKTLSTENNRPMSFYGKVNLLKTFGDDGTIQIGRDLDLDPMGTAIEGGVGINAQLSHNFSLHGDVNYQQKLQKTGISGASFSGGIRYQF